MRHEKQELHAQFAREIEAAHAQLGQQETQLASEHLRALQELRDQHKEGMVTRHTHTHFVNNSLYSYVYNIILILITIMCPTYSPH